jgi:hypothetical protein
MPRKYLFDDTPIYIYKLIDPRNESIKYIGWCLNIRKRLTKHLSEARNGPNTHKNNWLRKLLSLNLKPRIEIIIQDVYKNKDNLETYWISFYGRKNLTNDTDGGDGMMGCLWDEDRKELYAKRRRENKYPNPSSNYICVYYDKKAKKWKGRVTSKGIRYCLRHWDTEIEAAKEYDQAARRLFGENTILNFPDIPFDPNYQLPIRGKRNSRATSKYFGVSFDPRSNRTKRWYAWIVVDKKMINLGSYYSEIEAALIYNEAAEFYY